MRIFRWAIWGWLALLPGLVWAQAATPTWDELQKRDALPKELTLSARREKLSETEDGALYKVTYRSINDQTVPALLFLPKKAKAPMPVVVLQHGFTGSKEQMLQESTKAALVKTGFAGF